LHGTPALTVNDPTRLVALGARSQVDLAWDVTATDVPGITNRLDLVLSVDQRPALPTLPIILLGVRRWRFAGPIPAEGKSDRELFDTEFSSEVPGGPLIARAARPGLWREATGEGNAVPFPEPLTKAGVIYAQCFTWSPVARAVRIGAAANTPVKVWLNGKLVAENFVYRPHRPNSDGQYDNKPIPYVNTELQTGWNEILIKYVRGDGPLEPAGAPFEADLILCDPTELNANLTDQVRNRFPWE
jgi:hypothetical protein